jgi:hypothetical protein
MGAKKS